MLIGDRKDEGRVDTILLHVIWKTSTPSENRLTAILNWKSLSPSWDSNPACPDRKPSLFQLCHHHYLTFKLILYRCYDGFPMDTIPKDKFILTAKLRLPLIAFFQLWPDPKEDSLWPVLRIRVHLAQLYRRVMKNTYNILTTCHHTLHSITTFLILPTIFFCTDFSSQDKKTTFLETLCIN